MPLRKVSKPSFLLLNREANQKKKIKESQARETKYK
jgi:hypothetical protein